MAQQKHWETLARRGDVAAQRALEGPPFSEIMASVWGWFCELAPTRDVDMNGVRPFTYPMIESWARLTGRNPDPLEVEALFALDRANRFPEEPTEPDE